MPGTHSDNDHSFIEMLPFPYKKVAYLILRTDTLEAMLSDLKQQNFSAFNEIKKSKAFDIKTVQKTFYACIVAKITSFSKNLCVNETQRAFLQDTLYKALIMLLNINTQDLKVIQARLKPDHAKTLRWIERDQADELKTRALEIRLRRGNNRRYFRYHANLSYHFVRIGSHEAIIDLPGDIHSSGIKHFNKVMNKKLDTIAARYTLNIGLSLEQSYPHAYSLFMEVLQKLEILKEILNGVSLGVLDVRTAKSALRNNTKNGLDYASLDGNVRTEQILKDFEAKLNQINNNTLTLIEKSTPHKLYDGPVLGKLKIDFDIKGYIEKNSKNASKLLQSFIDLYRYTLLIEKVYNNISSSSYVIVFPEYWSKDYHDISPGGFAFFSEFLLEKNDILELYFQIDVSTSSKPEYETIHQKAKVVRIEERPALEKYLIACEFLMCPEKTITLISNAIQGQEVKDAFESASTQKVIS